jgi:serine/threonine protein kinase
LCTSANGQQAFFKAIDLFGALKEPNVLAALNALTDGVMCEQELLKLCQKMDRVVSALAFGTIRELRGQALLIPIPYIIFEWADGNVRHVVRASVRPTYEWMLRTLHQVTTGLMQLHRERIAHQDLKLSNALHFDRQSTVKIADLGRSVSQNRAVWYDQAPWPGDWAYAPPEVVYGFLQAEFNDRRLGADMYLLGNFAVTLLTGVTMNALMQLSLPADFQPPAYSGTFEHVLAHLQDAFDEVMERLSAEVPNDLPVKADLLMFIRQWCEPDPRRRGHPRTRALQGNGGNVFELERYASALPNMALRVAGYERRPKK